MYEIFFTNKSEKELNKLIKDQAKNVLNKISRLSFPFPPSLDIKKLGRTKSSFRIRIGKVRVIFEIDSNKKEIWIRKIGYRKDVYRLQ